MKRSLTIVKNLRSTSIFDIPNGISQLVSNTYWVGLIFILGMTSSCNRSAAPDTNSGLVKRISLQEVEIHGGKSALLDNDQLQSRFYFVRHAEKDTVGKDPALLPAGTARAENLATILKDLPLRRIYSTNYQRTRLTAAPTAAAMHLKTWTYTPSGQNQLLDELIQQTQNGHYLMVGHSNTVPQMLNHLAGKTVYNTIAEKTYDNLYLASIYQNGRVDILELKY